MTKRFDIRIRDSRGDTIIEVLIVLAVLGLAFAISYATANRGLIVSRNAEEHSEALGLLDSQAELLRTAIGQNISSVTSPDRVFCMDDTSGNYVGFNGSLLVTNNFPTTAAADSNGGYTEYPKIPPGPGSCVVSTEPFHESIVYVSSSTAGQSYYDLRVRWDGIGSLGPQQEEINYKITNSAIAFGNGFSWFATGNLFNHVSGSPAPAGYNYAPGPTTCQAYGDDSGNTGTSDKENFCNPKGPGVPIPVNYCGYPVTDTGTNIDPGGSAVYMRRASLVTYYFSSGTIANPPIKAGPAFLTINFNQYQGSGFSPQSPPPQGYLTTIDPIYNRVRPPIQAGTMQTPDLNKRPPQPSPNYAYQVDIIIHGTGGTWQSAAPALLHPTPVPGNGATATPSVAIPVTVPGGPQYIQIGWRNNEHDQDGNSICTPNDAAHNMLVNPAYNASYDPDFQINSLQLSGQ